MILEMILVKPRASLLEKLDRYAPLGEQDAAQARRILQFVKSDPACFERSNRNGHITGSAWLVDPTGTKVLLTHHKKLGKWIQLGGHADGNPDVLVVALREAQEESGLKRIRPLSDEIFDVDVHLIPERESEPAHLHYDIRFALQSSETKFMVSDESHSLAWIDISKIREASQEESLLRMACKWENFFERRV